LVPEKLGTLEGTRMLSCETTERPAIIVVVLQELLVARDIEMIVRDARPGARVLVAQTLHEAVDSLPQGRIALAFVQVDAATIAASSLGHRVAADGGRVVVLCEEMTRRLPQGWKALPFPFVSADVASLLASHS
jgi:hypothetical protein